MIITLILISIALAAKSASIRSAQVKPAKSIPRVPAPKVTAPPVKQECRVTVTEEEQLEFATPSATCSLIPFYTPTLADSKCEPVALVKAASSVNYAQKHHKSLLNFVHYAELAGGVTPYIYIANLTEEFADGGYSNHYIKLDAIDAALNKTCHKWVVYTDLDMWFSTEGYKRMRFTESALNSIVPKSGYFVGAAEMHYSSSVVLIRNTPSGHKIMDMWRSVALQNTKYTSHDQPPLVATINRIIGKKNGRAMPPSFPRNGFDQKTQPLGNLHDGGRVQTMVNYDWTPFWFWSATNSSYPPLHKCTVPGCATRPDSLLHHFGPSRYAAEVKNIPIEFPDLTVRASSDFEWE